MSRASRLRRILSFMPQSTAIIFFGPLLYSIGFLTETSATRLSLFGSWNSMSLFATILPSIVPCVLSFCVNARVSMPVIAGMLCFLSQSPRLFLASQCEKFSLYSLTIRPLMCGVFDS